MVSEKTIAVLLIIAIVLSVLSIALTVTLNLTSIEIPGKTEDSGGGQVKLVIVPQQETQEGVST